MAQRDSSGGSSNTGSGYRAPSWMQGAEKRFLNAAPQRPAARPEPTNYRAQYADAQRYQQQGRSQLDTLYARWRANQAADKLYGDRTNQWNPGTSVDPGARQARQDAFDEQNDRATQAWADRYTAQTGRGQSPDEIWGVHYGRNWRRSDYIAPVDLRQGELAGIQMTPQEYIKRRNALERSLQPGYEHWYNRAVLTPGQSHDIYSQWRANNPRPGGYFQTNQEYTVRNNAAPTGQTYVPFGSNYINAPKLPSNASSPTVAPQPNSSGGGGGGGGGWGGGGGYGGGGGGGGGQAANFWNQFLNWRVLEIQGG